MCTLRQLAHLWHHAAMRSTTELASTPGERLAKARRLAGLTQSDLADELGIGRRSIARYEDDADPAEPSKGILIAWAVVTDVPLHWLETGELSVTESVTAQYSDAVIWLFPPVYQDDQLSFDIFDRPGYHDDQLTFELEVAA